MSISKTFEELFKKRFGRNPSQEELNVLVDQSVISINQGGGITAHTVNIAPPRPEVTDELVDSIIARMDLEQPLTIAWRNRGRGPKLAKELEEGLIARGVTIGGKIGIGFMNGVVFDKPFTFSPNGFQFEGASIGDGAQIVAIETEL